MHIIEYQEKLYKFENLVNELEDHFINRCWFIVKNIHNFKNNYIYLEKLSYIWVNIKYLNVSYESNILEEVNKCILI
jgi:hypothetical protein